MVNLGIAGINEIVKVFFDGYIFMQFFIILIIDGFLAGMLGGLLGIGGGIVLMPVLRFVVGLSPAEAAGTCILAVFFTTLGGTFRHYKLRHINLRSILPVIAAGMVSTIVFSVFFKSFASKPSWLDLSTGLVFFLLSTGMVIEGLAELRGKKTVEQMGNELHGSLAAKLAVGGFAGILPGLLGIGTGAVLVPVFTFILKAPVKVAIGSSLACFCANAFLSSSFKLLQGHAIISAALPLCLGALIGSNVGAIVNKRFPTPMLKIMFGMTFLYVSSKYIFLFFGVKL